MKIVYTAFAVLTMWPIAAVADSPAPPFAYVAAAGHGMSYFKMVPRHDELKRDKWGRPDGFGVAYRLRPDGSDEELWRTEGWYSFRVYLSHDSKYLVAMGPWNGGHEPKKEDLAIAFYHEGRLLKEYSTAELVEDRTKVRASTSHYMWLAQDVEPAHGKIDPDAELRVLWPNTFRLKTCDGIIYDFDMTTGAIKRKKA